MSSQNFTQSYKTEISGLYSAEKTRRYHTDYRHFQRGISKKLRKVQDYWSLWIIEGGERGCVYSSCSETMACTMLYYLLVDGLHKASRPLGEPRPVMNRITGLFHRSSDSAIRNCDELETRLVKAGVRFWCTLPGDPPWNEGWALEHNLREKTWDLFCHERGEKYLVNSFYWESTACEELYSAVIRLADPDRLR